MRKPTEAEYAAQRVYEEAVDALCAAAAQMQKHNDALMAKPASERAAYCEEQFAIAHDLDAKLYAAACEFVLRRVALRKIIDSDTLDDIVAPPTSGDIVN